MHAAVTEAQGLSEESRQRQQRTAEILQQYHRVADDAKRNVDTALAFLDVRGPDVSAQETMQGSGMPARSAAVDTSSYQMLKENFEEELNKVRSNYEEALNAARGQLNELCDQYERLQASQDPTRRLQSSMQIRQITERRDKLVDQVRAETELRLKSESYMNQALIVVARLTGQNLHDISPESILFGEQLDRGQHVLQHGRYVIEMKSKLRNKLTSLMEVDFRVRTKLILQTCLHAWTRLARRRRVLARCYERIYLKHVVLVKLVAFKRWRVSTSQARLKARKHAKALSHRPSETNTTSVVELCLEAPPLLLADLPTDKFLRKVLTRVGFTRCFGVGVATADWPNFGCGRGRSYKSMLWIRAERTKLKAIMGQWYHCRYKFGSVRALAFRHLRSVVFEAFERWSVGYARHLLSLKRSLRCVKKIVALRRGRFLRMWKKIVNESKHESLVEEMNVKHEMLAEVRRELKDSKESNLVLSNRVAVLESQLSQSLGEKQLLLGRLKKLEDAFEEQERATLTAAGIVEEAMMQVSSESGAGAAKLMALYKRVQELEGQLQGANMMNKRRVELSHSWGMSEVKVSGSKLYCDSLEAHQVIERGEGWGGGEEGGRGIVAATMESSSGSRKNYFNRLADLRRFDDEQ
ncbi:hypothetical protein GUITHDRAFT_138140 [Guillardia theta CCMP2712]|uniref:Uncharacterized protein n=1 Tax=Guillardia theta (strain CCMP2712) TaxID=905079 RepID=L1JCZ9_GUITC|nr:hypothetical protein GUITHDRAFT_138140 [Guillardia theta CCMP2712]EKX46381.1 hypothetical protein GUITHDRAFT_138140 [Guillardia theta CCMP2712]|eukprot:XP_005833361.1 hypothetical protein GUITHDRAFT_138140 [Guillardia theta CCMP2712]